MKNSTFEINYTYNGKRGSLTIEAETFQKALACADYARYKAGAINGDILPVSIKDWDYSNSISIKCIDTADLAYKHKNINNEEIKELFLTKEDILFALNNNIMAVRISTAEYCPACYCADNYFFIDSENTLVPYSEDMQEYEANLEAVPTETVADRILEVLDEFITEFPLEYELYHGEIKYREAKIQTVQKNDKPKDLIEKEY